MKNLTEEIKEFVKKRDWEQFHSPKNLAIGLAVEANELLEIFTWLKDTESKNLTETQLDRIKDEVGDVFIYLINFCEKLSLDPVRCAKNKLIKNNNKYPVDKSIGRAIKYTDL